MLTPFVKSVIDPLFSLIVPNQCLACHRYESMDHGPFCLACHNELPLLKNEKDNKIVMQGKLNLDDSIIKTYSLMFYYKSGISKHILHQIKYYNKRYLAIHMGQMIAQKYDSIINANDILVPVPLHPKKENDRGYNQAALIAQGIAKSTALTIQSDLLKRVINNSSQTQKSARERRDIMQKTYSLYDGRTTVDPNRRYVIVDDVITTGATIGACEKLLLAAGAKNVIAISLAVAV